MDNGAQRSAMLLSLDRLSRPLLAGASLHVGAWLLASTTTCTRKTEEVVGWVCHGRVGLRFAVALFAISLVGTPVLLSLLFRRASQRRPVLLAWSAQTLVPAASYGLLLGVFSSDMAGTGVLWEGATQLVAVPVYVVVMGSLLQRAEVN